MQSDTFSELHWLLDIIQSTDVGIVVIDEGFKIEVYNRFMQAHSNVNAEDIIGTSIFDVFPDLNDDWFIRRVNSVFKLGVPVYTTFNQRDNIFDFKLKLPIHSDSDHMYQNTTFVPLRSSANQVLKVAIIVYDETNMAESQKQLENAKAELLTLSRTDKLTGLNNRGYWEERLYEEFNRNKRYKDPTSLVIFDIDHFKKINDNYGHTIGDDTIRYVAKTVLDLSRDIDICGRYGGEEFTVILPKTDRDGARVFSERLRETIANNVLKSCGESLQFTVSLGICTLSADITSAHEWLVNADTALYYSKENGRNLTSIFPV